MSHKKQKIAILGATGYIGRSLIGRAHELGIVVDVFSHDVTNAQTVLSSYGISAPEILPYDVLLEREYDVIVNATGAGNPKKLSENPMTVFSITEAMDTLLLRYLKNYPATRVFNISSGSIFGISAGEAIAIETKAVFDLGKDNCYAIAKLTSETKHRLVKEYAIVDLRVFAFVSRWLDPSDTFFLAEVAQSLLDEETFCTNSSDMIRDYTTQSDLWDTIVFLLQLPPMNAAFDMRSQSPVSKSVLLEHLKQVFDLRYEMADIAVSGSPTGEKKEYYSKSSSLIELGYTPTATTLENVERELRALLSQKRNLEVT